MDKLRDSEKLILVYYHDFNHIDNYMVNKMMTNADSYFNSKFDSSVRVLVVPTFKGDGNNHFEYINRDKCTEDELKHIEECIAEYNKTFYKSYEKENKFHSNYDMGM